MPYIKIDGSDNRVLRTMSDRLDLGPNGPQVLVQVAMTLVMLVVVLVWATNFLSNSGADGPLRFAPLLLVALGIASVVRSIRSARTSVKEGWRD